MIDQGIIYNKPPKMAKPLNNFHHHPVNSPKKRPLQFKRATSTIFMKINPVLMNGEPAYEYDTKRLKIGDGRTRYSDLPYIGDYNKNGKSAYQIWIDQGNEGTIEDFLDSLIGPSGKSSYELWLGLGNEGTILDFINSLHGATGEKGDKGEKGDVGKSAYDEWIDQGNEGTIIDFLNSLNGKSAYDIWVDNGNEGDQEVFLQSIIGKSAYQIWLDQGNEGNEMDFIN